MHQGLQGFLFAWGEGSTFVGRILIIPLKGPKVAGVPDVVVFRHRALYHPKGLKPREDVRCALSLTIALNDAAELPVSKVVEEIGSADAYLAHDKSVEVVSA